MNLLRRLRQLSNRKSRGFTLIELIVVISLMSILLTFTFPALKNVYQNWQLDLSADKLRQSLLYLRTSSITDQCRYKFVVQSDNRGYSVLREDLDEQGEPSFVSPSGKWGKIQYFPEDLQVAANKTEVIFYPDGTATPAEFTLGIKDMKMTLILDGALGYAKVQDTTEL